MRSAGPSLRIRGEANQHPCLTVLRLDKRCVEIRSFRKVFRGLAFSRLHGLLLQQRNLKVQGREITLSLDVR